MTTPTTLSKQKKWYTKKWVYIIGIAALLVGTIAFSSSRNSTPEIQYETSSVVRGTLTQTVDASGNIQSSDDLDLRFESSGRVAKVYAQINQEVKAGTVLAELDLGELNARVAQASASLAQAQANFDKVQAGETSQYISNLKAKLDQAEATLSQIQANANDAIANAEAALAKAEINLKLSEGGADSQVVRDAYNDAVGFVIQIQSSVAKSLNEADNILGIDNAFANDSYESQLSIEKPSNLTLARSQYLIASADRKSLDNSANTLSLSSSQIDIENALGVADKALTSAKDLLYKVSEVLNATVAVGGMTQSTLDSLKSTISSERVTINSQYSLLITQKQEIQASKNSYSTSKIAYDTAVQNLSNAKLKAAADVTAYEALAAQAKAQYEDAVEPPRVEDVRSAQAQVQEARASVAAAVAQRNKSRIVAPIAGKVAKVAFKPGEFATSQDVVVKLVSPRFEVKVDIPETDIVKIATGVSTTVALDAYGNDVKFNGIVTEVETGETVIQDVVYYTVTVVLEEREEYEILNGMTADVIFYTEEKENVLYVPQRAIRSEESKKFVRILENQEVREVEVTTGLRGDDGFIEIISGLTEGQEVIVREKSA